MRCPIDFLGNVWVFSSNWSEHAVFSCWNHVFVIPRIRFNAFHPISANFAWTRRTQLPFALFSRFWENSFHCVRCWWCADVPLCVAQFKYLKCDWILIKSRTSKMAVEQLGELPAVAPANVTNNVSPERPNKVLYSLYVLRFVPLPIHDATP